MQVEKFKVSHLDGEEVSVKMTAKRFQVIQDVLRGRDNSVEKLQTEIDQLKTELEQKDITVSMQINTNLYSYTMRDISERATDLPMYNDLRRMVKLGTKAAKEAQKLRSEAKGLSTETRGLIADFVSDASSTLPKWFMALTGVSKKAKEFAKLWNKNLA